MPAFPRARWQNDVGERNAIYSSEAPRLPWDVFTRKLFRPTPGEHVTIIGSSGKGKSNLLNNILPMYPFTAVFATKNSDTTLDRLAAQQNYIILDRWRKLPAKDYPRRIIWPKSPNLKDLTVKQKAVFEDAVEHIWAEGGQPKNNPVGWAIGIDEIWWIAKVLGMEMYVRLLLQQARSAGISLISATQRPANIPTELYSQPTHLFFFLTKDENNLQRIGDLNAGNKPLIRSLVSNLEQYQVLYVNNLSGQMARTRTPAPKG